MRLHVQEAVENPGKEFPFSFLPDAALWAEEDALADLEGTIDFSGTCRYDGQRLHVDGIITTRGHYVCTRCLTKFYAEREIPVTEIYQTEATDDDALVYDGKTVDVLSLLRDTLIIELPYQVLCHEDCRGLCVNCGCNLNKDTCHCHDTEPDPRWAALAAWKEK